MSRRPRPGLSAPPSGIAANLRKFLSDMIEQLRVWRGDVGDRRDQVVTFGDLEGSDAGNVRYNAGGPRIEPKNTPREVIKQQALSNLSATPLFESVLLDWDGINQRGYVRTEVWRNTADDFGTATRRGTAIASVFVDNATPGQTYYYWVRAVSETAVGPINAVAGTEATTALRPEYLKQELTDQLESTELSSDLRDTLNSSFRQQAAPTVKSDGSSLVPGDRWVETDGSGNTVEVHTYTGTAWVALDIATGAYVDTQIVEQVGACKDSNGNVLTGYSDKTSCEDAGYTWDDDVALAQKIETVSSTANSKNSVYRQAAAPSNPAVGDLWFDTSKDHYPARYQGNYWEGVRDLKILDVEAIAESRNTVFKQSGAPTANTTGDLWIDTDDKNHLYIWDGSSWNDAQDQEVVEALNTAQGRNTIFRQAGQPTANTTGDLWIDTDDGNHLYRWSGSAWVDVQDQDAVDALNTAQSRNTIFKQTTSPTANAIGDLWIDTDNDNHLYRWSGTSWEDVQDQQVVEALNTANGRNTIFRQNTAPTANTTGDLWIDSDDDNKPYRWDGSSWVAVRDSKIDAVETIANSKVKTFRQAGQPTAQETGDLWIDTDGGDRLYRWDGNSWVDVQDQGISDNQATISTQQTTINGLEAQYSVKIDNNGRVAGFGLSSEPTDENGIKSQFIVRANYFGITVPASQWQSNQAYATNEYVRPTAASYPDGVTDSGGDQLVYRCSTAGTTGGTEPSWPTTAGSTVTDSGVVWEAEKEDNLTPFIVGTVNGAIKTVINDAVIPDASIGTAAIKDLAVDGAKIADLVVDSAKIANLTVGTEKITDNAVTNQYAATDETGNFLNDSTKEGVWYTGASVNLTASASQWFVLYGVDANVREGASGDQSQITMRSKITNNTTGATTTNPLTPFYVARVRTTSSVRQQVGNSASTGLTFSPSSGDSYTVEVQYLWSSFTPNDSDTSANVRASFIYLTEFKK